MGLPPLLVDTYRRYKKETETFVQWLASTARGTGTVESVFETGQQQDSLPAGGRLKGKARKEAKKHGLSANTNVKTFQVHLKTFTKLADAIAAAKAVEVPRYMLTILCDVIQARKNCAAWFLANQEDADEATQANNERHQYFISVLESVLRTLRSKQQPAVRQEQGIKSESSQPTNIFECLELEDPAELDWVEEDVKTKGDSKSPVSYTLEPSQDETSFATYCFLKDATDIRIFVRRTWREFKRGEISLITAGLTMNAAIKKIEQLNNDFCESFEKFQDHGDIINFIQDGYCTSQPGCPFLDTSEIPFNYEANGQKLSSDTMLCTHTTELVYALVLNVETPEYQHKPSMRLSADETVLAKCLSQLVAFGGFNSTGAFNDEVSRAASFIYNEVSAPTWAIFAIQIFWDTRREFGSKLHRGLDCLKKDGGRVLSAYKAYFDLKDADSIGMWHKMHRAHVIEVRNIAQEMTQQDFVQRFINSTVPKDKSHLYDLGERFLLRNHPALCGLFAASVTINLHMLSINMAGDQGMILSAAHLYNAAHQSGLLPRDTKWADMDWIIEKQGSEWMFVGKRPEEGLDFKKRFQLAFGFGIETLAPDFNSAKAPKDHRNHSGKRGKNRRLRYCARHVELTVKRRLPDGRYQQTTRAAREIASLTEFVVVDWLDNQSNPKAKSRAKPKDKKAKRRNMTSIETLAAFKEALKQDEFPLSFNVMSLYLRCIKLLRDIQAYCIEKAPLDYPQREFSEGLDMNQVVGSMLLDLAGRPRAHGSMFPEAVNFLREAVEKEGDAELSQATASMERKDIGDGKVVGEEEPSFENPPEDGMSLLMRQMAGMIMIQDENGDVRMPFGMR